MELKYTRELKEWKKKQEEFNNELTLLPQKIFVHLPQKSSNLEFINTLKLIFENKLEICTDCNICNLYKNLNTSFSFIKRG